MIILHGIRTTSSRRVGLPRRIALVVVMILMPPLLWAADAVDRVLPLRPSSPPPSSPPPAVHRAAAAAVSPGEKKKTTTTTTIRIHRGGGAAPAAGSGPVLVVGATGSTGLRALLGLLDSGIGPERIRLMTRNPGSALAVALRRRLPGITVVRGDLGDVDGGGAESLREATAGCAGCYIHALAGDDRAVAVGLAADRAARLADALEAHAAPGCRVVLNSAAAEKDHGVERIQQYHDTETVLFARRPRLAVTALRANLFMEEFWKVYLRPGIRKNGRYGMSVPSGRRLYLTSVRDMGRIAGSCISSPADDPAGGGPVNVAGDVLTAAQIAEAFGRSQGSPAVAHSPQRFLAVFCRFFFPELYELIRFYRTSTETTDVEGLRARFPGLVTDFPSFLDETEWENEELSYEQFRDPDRVFRSYPVVVGGG